VAGDVSDLVDGCVRKEFDAELRNATVMVNRFAVDVVPELVSSGAIDLGLVVVWPGGPAGVPTDARPVFQEELVAVGGDRHTGVAVPVEHLAHRLVVAGPAAQAENGVLRSLRHDISHPLLVKTAPDVATGLRLVAVTRGTMVLPRSEAPTDGSLPVRPIDPERWVDTALLVTPARHSDPVVSGIVERLVRTVAGERGIRVHESMRGRWPLPHKTPTG
jgi:hypothetical protein